ncbi:MAG TPA: arginine deiminase family protein [Acidobacteriaceae bacterium]|nr:arginine deiminase family protein [Acidobacteriaceae bacterium]
MFTEAIVRIPGRNFDEGLTTVQLGVPRFALVLAQHAEYCAALRGCGLNVTTLEADLDHPDSTFIEDTAVVTPRSAMLTRPGAQSREGEAAAMRPILRRFFPALAEIEAPGTLDGGDICEAGNHFFLGVSQRTNHEGARQLAVHLESAGYTSEIVDVRGIQSILHLKSGVSYIGENTLVVIEEMAGMFSGYEQIVVAREESYAANCVRVNDRVLVPAGYRLVGRLRERGFDPLELDMSEFQKMDGGLSCLSLRF